MKTLASFAGVLLAGSILCAPAFAASVDTNQTAATPRVAQFADASASVGIDPAFRVFAPQHQTKRTRLDYSVWDSALENVVLKLGQSIRRRAGRPNAESGTRIVKGHKSAYRLEGSRVTFSYINDEYKQGLSNYRSDLERIGNMLDLVHLSRDEQLAYWFNLHNVMVIEQIALNYPVKRPSKIKVGAEQTPLHEAKLVTIKGVPLSLRDIRQKIVYANWQDPNVIYGFFHGDIGGPSIQNYALTPNNMKYVLELQAVEFVNSLRGVHKSRKGLKVSSIYEEAKPYLFKRWPTELKTHLLTHAGDNVDEEIKTGGEIVFDRYDPIVADLLAGDRPSTANLNLSVNGRVGSSRVSPEVARLLRELEDKTEIMRKRGMIRRATGGTVTIEDLDTVDIDVPPPPKRIEE